MRPALVELVDNESRLFVRITSCVHYTQVMVTNVTSLLKTVKTVEDKAARGTRALESAIEAIGQEIRVSQMDSVTMATICLWQSYSATEHVERKLPAEELLRHTRPVTVATAKAVAAGNSCKQEDVIHAANIGRKVMFDLLTVCKSAAHGAEAPEVRARAIRAGRECAQSYKELLESVNLVRSLKCYIGSLTSVLFIGHQQAKRGRQKQTRCFEQESRSIRHGVGSSSRSHQRSHSVHLINI